MSDIHQAAKLHQQGNLDEAERIYLAILNANPKQFDARHLLGVVYMQRGDAERAVTQISLALTITPQNAQALSNLANAFSALRRYEEALVNYDRAIALKPDFADALINRGNALKDLRRIPEALESFDRAFALAPNRADLFLNRGTALKQAKRYSEALQDFDRALALKPDYPEVHNNRATTLKELKRFDESLAAFDRALALKPDFADAHANRGNLLKDMKRLEEARDSYARALPLMRQNALVDGLHLHTKMLLSDWRDYDALTAALRAKVNGNVGVTTPWSFLTLPSTAQEQLTAATAYAARMHPPLPPLWRGEKYRHDKIRLAYLSADYHEHATAFLMAGLFERHDRAKFDLTAISFGRDDSSPMRQRLVAAFDTFIDVNSMSDEQVSRLLRDKEIDIAIDLKGFTQDARTDILARRCAPVQVNYIGYPGTMGAPYIDYIIGDETIIPPDMQGAYSEKVVWLPDTYQVNDSKRDIAPATPSRAALGLPEKGFVFCSFNNNYKITPDIFSIWMRLLKAVEGSVLWLLEVNPGAAANLRREAEERGVSVDRLVFAPKTGLEEHLARHRHADLFLDTLPCNAHTTASDALWAGLPVLTCMGDIFTGRVAGSLLRAAGVPELITQSLEEYEQLALTFARDAQRLAAVKSKISRDCALFDTERYTRKLEAAYIRMRERSQRGQPPESFKID